MCDCNSSRQGIFAKGADIKDGSVGTDSYTMSGPRATGHLCQRPWNGARGVKIHHQPSIMRKQSQNENKEFLRVVFCSLAHSRNTCCELTMYNVP